MNWKEFFKPIKISFAFIVIVLFLFGCSKTITEENLYQEKERINNIMITWFTNYKTDFQDTVHTDIYEQALSVKQIQEIYLIYSDELSNKVNKWLVIFEDEKGNCMLEAILDEGRKEPSTWTHECRQGSPDQRKIENFLIKFNSIEKTSLSRIVKSDNAALGYYYSLYLIEYKDGTSKTAKVYMADNLSKCLLNEDINCQ